MCTSLTSLRFPSQSEIYDTGIICVLDKNMHLKELKLEGAFIKDKSVEKISMLPLTSLDLSYNILTDIAAIELTRCKTLTQLSLKKTKIIPQGISYLKGLPNLKYLNI